MDAEIDYDECADEWSQRLNDLVADPPAFCIAVSDFVNSDGFEECHQAVFQTVVDNMLENPNIPDDTIIGYLGVLKQIHFDIYADPDGLVFSAVDQKRLAVLRYMLTFEIQDDPDIYMEAINAAFNASVDRYVVTDAEDGDEQELAYRIYRELRNVCDSRTEKNRADRLIKENGLKA